MIIIIAGRAACGVGAAFKRRITQQHALCQRRNPHARQIGIKRAILSCCAKVRRIARCLAAAQFPIDQRGGFRVHADGWIAAGLQNHRLQRQLRRGACNNLGSTRHLASFVIQNAPAAAGQFVQAVSCGDNLHITAGKIQREATLMFCQATH